MEEDKRLGLNLTLKIVIYFLWKTGQSKKGEEDGLIIQACLELWFVFWRSQKVEVVWSE